MLAQEEFVEVHALRRRGWSISAIARHLGRDRKTVRAHLSGERIPGQRAAAEPRSDGGVRRETGVVAPSTQSSANQISKASR